MRILEPTMTRKDPTEPQAGDDVPGSASRRAIRQIAVTAFAIALMTGLGLMLMDVAIDKLSSLSFLRLSGLF